MCIGTIGNLGEEAIELVQIFLNKPMVTYTLLEPEIAHIVNLSFSKQSSYHNLCIYIRVTKRFELLRKALYKYLLLL